MKKKYFNIFVQFWTVDCDLDTLNLLRFPASMDFITDMKLKLKRTVDEEKKYTKPKDINKTISFLSGQKLNEVALTFNFEPFEIEEEGVTLLSIHNELSFFANHALWALRSSDPLNMGDIIQYYPTSMESLLTCYTKSKNMEELYAFAFDMVAVNIPEQFYDKVIFGAIDIIEFPYKDIRDIEAYRYDKVISRLAPYNKEDLNLDKNFDDVHPIMIGPYDKVINLSNSFDEQVTVRKLHNPKRDMGMLRFDNFERRKKEIAKNAASFIIEGDKTKEYIYKLHKGEFFLTFEGGPRYNQVVRTTKRWQTMWNENMISEKQKEESEIVEDILPKYCAMLNINPDDMLAGLGYKGDRAYFEQEVDEYFSELPDSIPLEERILEAHICNIYHKSTDMYAALTMFIRNKYFKKKV